MKSWPTIIAAVGLAAVLLANVTGSAPGPAAGRLAETAARANGAGSALAGPAPHIQQFADRLRGQVRPPGVPGPPVPVPEGVDGCDHAYGAANQCVPWTFPPGTGNNRCAWLVARGLAPVAVHGRDRHGLDSNRDGVACGPGDR